MKDLSKKRSKITLESLLPECKVLTGKQIIGSQKANTKQLEGFGQAAKFEERQGGGGKPCEYLLRGWCP